MFSLEEYLDNTGISTYVANCYFYKICFKKLKYVLEIDHFYKVMQDK